MYEHPAIYYSFTGQRYWQIYLWRFHLLQVRPHIEIQCGACVGVSQNLLHTFDVRAVAEQQGGATVAEVVWGHIRQAIAVHKSFQAVCQCVR